MKNDYSILDDLKTVPFILPIVACGEYSVKDDFDTLHKFAFRRMPRARRYTGRYGLFYHDPDAHWVLVGVVIDGQFQLPVELPKEMHRRLSLFLLGRQTLVVQRCAWCGREMERGNNFVHASETCRKNLVDRK